MKKKVLIGAAITAAVAAVTGAIGAILYKKNN